MIILQTELQINQQVKLKDAAEVVDLGQLMSPGKKMKKH